MDRLQRQIRSETVKLRTVASTAALAASTVILELGFKVISAFLVDATSPADGDVVFALKPSITYAVCTALIGTLAASSEWRYGLSSQTYTVQPDRRLVLGAKTLVAGLWAATVGTVATAVSMVGSLLVLDARAVPVPEIGVLAVIVVGSVVTAAAMATVGVAVGTLATNQTVAIGIVVTLLLVIPPLAILVSPEVYAFSLTGVTDGLAAQQEANPALQSSTTSVAVLTAYLGAALVLSAGLVERRDIR